MSCEFIRFLNSTHNKKKLAVAIISCSGKAVQCRWTDWNTETQQTFRRKLWEVAADKGEHEVLPTNSDYKIISWTILWVNLLDWLSDWLLEFIAINSDFWFAGWQVFSYFGQNFYWLYWVTKWLIDQLCLT